MKMRVWNCLKSKRGVLYTSVVVVVLLVMGLTVYGQDGGAGIRDANQKVRGYYKDGADLMYGVCAIVGLIGAVRVYQKWTGGDPDTGKVAASWFGGCVFAVVVVTVIKMFFGIQ